MDRDTWQASRTQLSDQHTHTHLLITQLSDQHTHTHTSSNYTKRGFFYSFDAYRVMKIG